MKRILREHLMTVFKIFVIVMVVGLLGATFAISKVSAAASSPIKVQYDGKTRHNLKIGVGKTTGNYLSFTLTDKGTINSATWSSSNTSVLAVVSKTGSKGTAKCKFKGVKEGHAVLKLTVKTTKSKKNYTYTEYVGVSVFTDIKDMYGVSYAIPETYIYRGATTEQYESEPCIGSEYRNHAFYNILYQCGGYYFVQKVCEPVWSNGKIVRTITDFAMMNKIYEDGSVCGFVKKTSLSTATSNLVYGIEMSNTNENYPMNYEKNLSVKTTPVNVPVTYKWSSSNTNVVTISSTGLMKTVGPGEATITVSYGTYEIKRKIRVTGLVVYNPQTKKNEVNDSPESVRRELNSGFTYSNILPTDDVPYDIACDIKYEPTVLCNTSNRYFESLDMFNTNCYGFVINQWGFCENSNSNMYGGAGFTPGYISDTYEEDMLDCSGNVAELVKNDIEYLGGEAEILGGEDNNPNYPTDENHYLIAIRTNGAYYSHLYDFHFMIKKNGRWYFKDGLKGGIIQLEGGNNPGQVLWNSDYKDYGDGYEAGYTRRYIDSIQYMVISKLPVKITAR